MIIKHTLPEGQNSLKNSWHRESIQDSRWHRWQAHNRFIWTKCTTIHGGTALMIFEGFTVWVGTLDLALLVQNKAAKSSTRLSWFQNPDYMIWWWSKGCPSRLEKLIAVCLATRLCLQRSFLHPVGYPIRSIRVGLEPTSSTLLLFLKVVQRLALAAIACMVGIHNHHKQKDKKKCANCICFQMWPTQPKADH